MGLCYYKLKNFEKALEFFKKSYDILPNDSSLYDISGIYYL